MIIGIAGEAGSGKGTTAEVLIERGFVKGKFAGALKEMFRALLRYRGLDDEYIERLVEGDLKELPNQWLNGKSPRHAMQTLGAWGRNDIDEDFWVDVEFDSKNGVPDLLFDDLRHDNEEAAIVKRGGVVLQIIGRGGINSDHLSESFVPKIATVIDNSGTIPELRDKVTEFASDLSWAA
jgi:hypothetical protein